MASKKGPPLLPQPPLTKLQKDTPGCACSRCQRIRGIKRDGPPDGRSQGGRVQHAASELGWGEVAAEGGGSNLLSHEASEREYREQRGIKELPAAFRHLIGPAPQLRRLDFTGARAYLTKIEAAINQGGWTRSEWARLYRMRDKWKKRSSGQDPRFNEIGNRTGGLNPDQLSRVKLKRTIGEIMDILKSELEAPSGSK